MRKLMVFALVMVVLGATALHIGAVPTVPPIPNPPTPPPETPEPTPPPSPGGGGVVPLMEGQQKFQVISTEPVMEGYAGGSIDFNLKVIQKGYPDLVVNLTADLPDKWKATFSKNDFDLKTDETVELRLSLNPPEDISAEQHEIKIHGVGKAKEDTFEVKDSLTLTAMTYLVDVGVVNLQLSPIQPRVGENVTVTVTAVNYTQRIISDVVVEFLVNNELVSRQSVTLPAGTSQPVTFGWTPGPGTFTLMIKSQTTGDNNRRNDSVNQRIVLESGTEQVDMLYQQAITLFAQENYAQARDLFATVATQYTSMGEPGKALDASQLQERCDSFIEAQNYMNQGDTAFEMENYEQATQYYERARDIYGTLADTNKQSLAQQKLDQAMEAMKSGINIYYIGIAVAAIVLVALVTVTISRRRSHPRAPASRYESRFRLEEPVSEAPPPASRPVTTSVTREPTPTGAAPPAQMVQFHQKTEDTLSRFSKGYIRDNLQQAMRVYLSLEGERKQLPRGRDLELDRIIDTNLRELEHRIFGTF
jgi:tetratricopeptide (TPR) repeat protein